MLGAKPVAAFLGLIAIFAIAGLILLSLAQPISRKHQGQYDQQPQSQHEAARPEKSADTDQQSDGWTQVKKSIERNEKIITAFSTAVIAAFTIALVFATVALFISSEKVADAAKDSAEATNEAVRLSERTAERQ